MSEVAKVREALERLKPPPIQPGTLHHDVIAAFVVHGLKVCEEYEQAKRDDDGDTPGFHLHVIGLAGRLGVIADILRDAGLMEEGR